MTNNPLVKAAYGDEMPVEYTEETLPELLVRVRNKVHTGCRLLSHPLSGSVKPNETIYKSVVISKASGEIDPQSVNIIEGCIHTARKFPQLDIPESVLPELMEIDLSLIRPAVERAKQLY